MKKILLALALAAAVSVAGCQSTGGGTSPTQAADAVAKVQAYTRAACGFLPTVATILAIFKVSTVSDTIQNIGGAICNAVVPPAPTARTLVAKVPMVKGVVIKGEFVK